MSESGSRQAHLRELRAAKAEFEHQLRRYADAAERAGGVLGASEADVKRLKKNVADIAAIEDEIQS
ncbi:MAG: hypothetical protein JJ900_06655 [Rhodospirillales bacterium]|nr:hypothetical protein [Rhodospirillales bacterium]MBO6786517.1 hypothetical protein [Rhodospirillales bacterium]